MARIAVVGAGIVGSACAYYLARDGHDVTVFDRGPIGGGTTSRGEGNILVSDKAPGPELDLALWSGSLWRAIGREIGSERIELEAKGGLVVASYDEIRRDLTFFAHAQSIAGVDVVDVPRTGLADYEPHLTPAAAGGVFYPGDQQVQPVRAAQALVEHAQCDGAQVRYDAAVTGIERDRSGQVTGLTATCGGDDGFSTTLSVDAVVNATGTWAGQVSQRLGAPIDVLPRRGFVIVTEPLPRVVRHKVYTADYVANVSASTAGLETSVVVEGTRGGTVLIGASRERVGFDETTRYDVVRKLSAQAISLFPFLAQVSLMRVYHGFRPYCVDHLPVIGADARIPGLYHACGHEGAGIGLAPATGALIADLVSGRPSPVEAQSFSPQRPTLTQAHG